MKLKTILCIFLLITASIGYAQNPKFSLNNATQSFESVDSLASCVAVSTILVAKFNAIDALVDAEQAKLMTKFGFAIAAQLVKADKFTEDSFIKLTTQKTIEGKDHSFAELISVYAPCISKATYTFNLQKPPIELPIDVISKRFNKNNNATITRISNCALRVLTKNSSPDGKQSVLAENDYYFNNVESVEVVKTISLGTEKIPMDFVAKYNPYAVVVRGAYNSVVRANTTWFEPNPYNVPVRPNTANKFDLVFTDERDAKLFRSAVISFSKSCN